MNSKYKSGNDYPDQNYSWRIWHFLGKKSKVLSGELITSIEQPKEIIIMSLGWLAREGCVIVEQSEQDYRLLLRRGGYG